MRQLTAFTILFCAVIFTECSKSSSSSSIVPPPPPNSLDSGLIAYYPFNGNADDSSQNNFNLTVQGATLTTDRAGSANKAYHFNGVDAVMNVPPFTGTDSLPTFAVSVWIKTEIGGFVYALVDEHFSPAPEYMTIYKDTITNEFVVACFLTHYYSTGGSISRFLVDTIGDISDKWTHLVLVQDQTHTVLYVNGVKGSAEILDPWTIRYTGGGLIGGKPAQPQGHFDGNIDELRFYDRALTQAEIRKLYEE